MNVLKYPIITITIGFVLGILANYIFKPSFKYIIISIVLISSVFVFAFFRAKKKLFQDVFFGIVGYFLIITLGVLTHHIHTDLNYENHYSKVMMHEKNVFVGTILSIIKPNEKYNKYVLDLEKCDDNGVIGKILLYYSKEDSIVLPVGQRLFFYKKLHAIPKAFNPNQFDYSKYLEKQNIYHQVFCHKGDIKKVEVKNNIGHFFYELRKKLKTSFSIHQFTPKTRAILEALLLGNRSDMDKETMNNYAKAGVIHILAISGLHIGILFVILSSLLNPLDKKKYGSIFKLVIIITFLWFFAIITGFSASVARAVTLFTFISIGKYFNQQQDIYNGVAVSALILLMIQPNFIFDIGFQLSYAAVLSILLFQPFYERFYFSKNKIAVYFVDIVLVSLAAQIGVLPLSLYYFNQLPLLFLFANLLVIPLSSSVLVLGVITLIFNFVFQPVAILIGKFLVVLVGLMNNYVAYVSKIEGGIVTNIAFTESLVLFLYLLIVAFIFWVYNREWYAFRNTILSLLLFQIAYVIIKKNENGYDEFLVFNSKKSIIVIKQKNEVIFLTDEEQKNRILMDDYIQSTFIDSVNIEPLQNTISFHKKRILIVDSSAIYKISKKPDIIVLTQSPKINLERLIKENNPDIIVADNSNPFYKIDEWKATCSQEKIPFHATAEKGFYRLK